MDNITSKFPSIYNFICQNYAFFGSYFMTEIMLFYFSATLVTAYGLCILW